MWWLIFWGAAGVVLGCVTFLVVVFIRALADTAVVTWRTSDEPLPKHDKTSQ